METKQHKLLSSDVLEAVLLESNLYDLIHMIYHYTDLLQKSDPIHPNPDRSYQGWHAAWTDDGCGTSRDGKD